VTFDCGATKRDELRIEVPEDDWTCCVPRYTARDSGGLHQLVAVRSRCRIGCSSHGFPRNSYLSEYEINRVIDKMEAHGLKASARGAGGVAEGLQNSGSSRGDIRSRRKWIEKLHERGYSRHVLGNAEPVGQREHVSRRQNERVSGIEARRSELRIDWLENAVKIDFRKQAAAGVVAEVA